MGLLQLLFLPISGILRVIELGLFGLIHLYDTYCYTPLQTALSPLVAIVPRDVYIRSVKISVFTANTVSWTRTFLVVPVAWCLKYNFTITAFMCILLHDFLDHLDGIVAKVQRKIYGPIDDPLLGGFMDAFCDKIVNVLSLWTILIMADYSEMTARQTLFFVGACAIIIAYEFVIGVVRVQDYFQAYYDRLYGVEKTTTPNIAAVMEGKLKEKLESLGIAFLCLAQSSPNAMDSVSGVIGVVCLLLSVRLAHASLEHKLKSRRNQKGQVKVNKDPERNDKIHDTATDTEPKNCKAVQTDSTESLDKLNERKRSLSDISEDGKVDIPEKQEKSNLPEKQEKASMKTGLTRSHSVPSWGIRKKVDKVYTIGCFDLMHEGHLRLFENLREIGKQVVVGVHDSRSIFQLKNRVPIDDTWQRMMNVKQHADVVFCVHGTDPTPYLQCIFDENDGATSIYVRGDDMPNFPARDLTEQLMPVQFLPYTQSVSSTKIRNDVYSASQYGPHVSHDDDVMFY